MCVTRVMHLIRPMSPTLVFPVNFVFSVMRTLHGVHGLRVMGPTPFPLIKFVLRVVSFTRVMYVLSVITPPTPLPSIIFVLRVRSVTHVVHAVRVTSPITFLLKS